MEADRGTGFQPVLHGQDAHATGAPPCGPWKSENCLRIGLGFLLLYALACAVRLYVLSAQYGAGGEAPPFTLESALFFRQVQQVSHEGRLPTFDRAIEFPNGTRPAQRDSVGAEYVYAWLAARGPAAWSLTQRVRGAALLWFCLGAPLLAGVVRLQTGRWPSAWMAGALYAVALSAVMRSTGQELSRENFALPILLLHMLCALGAVRARRPGAHGAWQLASAAALAAALMSWDLIQYYIGLRWLGLAGLWFLGRWSRSRTADLAAELALLTLAGLVNPYLRAQGWVLSPLMGFGWGLAALAYLAPSRWTRGQGHRLALLVGLALLSWGLWPRLGPYRANYSHFSELLIAKLRFLNRKPLDPGLLTFNQRILWVPALHSASWALTARLFPGLLGLWLLAATTSWRAAWRRRDGLTMGWLLAGACSWLAYVFFVRFHVFVALFATLSVGAWLGSLATRSRPKIIAAWLIVLCAFTLEAAQTLRAPERWGRPNVYYQELQELTDWLRANAPGEPIVANFGLSAYVLTYAGNPIVLHPKFETPALRDRVEQYGTLLFTGPERALRDWIAAQDTELYVYALGEFFPESLPLQMRYFVNALEPPPDAPARRFEREPLTARYFQFLWGNRKYRVFRILTPAAERLAAAQAARAQAQLETGDLDAAQLLAAAALENDPSQPHAQRVLGHVLALQRAGFGQPHAPDPAP